MRFDERCEDSQGEEMLRSYAKMIQNFGSSVKQIANQFFIFYKDLEEQFKGWSQYSIKEDFC